MIKINTAEFVILRIIKRKNGINYPVIIVLETKENQIFEKKLEDFVDRSDDYQIKKDFDKLIWIENSENSENENYYILNYLDNPDN